MIKKMLLTLVCVALLVGTGYSAETLNDRVFVVVYDSELYSAVFFKGPFGPEEVGKMRLFLNGDAIAEYDYQYPGGEIVAVLGLCDFRLVGNSITQIIYGIKLTEYTYIECGECQ